MFSEQRKYRNTAQIVEKPLAFWLDFKDNDIKTVTAQQEEGL